MNTEQQTVAFAIRAAATRFDWRDLLSRPKRDARQLLRLIFQSFDALSNIDPIGERARIAEVANAVCAFAILGYSVAVTNARRKEQALGVVLDFFGNWVFNVTVPMDSPVRARDGDGSFSLAEKLKRELIALLDDRAKLYSALLTKALASQGASVPSSIEVSLILSQSIQGLFWRAEHQDPSEGVATLAAAAELLNLYGMASKIGA